MYLLISLQFYSFIALIIYIFFFEVLFENHIFYEKVSSIKMIIIIIIKKIGTARKDLGTSLGPQCYAMQVDDDNRRRLRRQR